MRTSSYGRVVEFENGVLNGGSHKVKRTVTRAKWDIEQGGHTLLIASRCR